VTDRWINKSRGGRRLNEGVRATHTVSQWGPADCVRKPSVFWRPCSASIMRGCVGGHLIRKCQIATAGMFQAVAGCLRARRRGASTTSPASFPGPHQKALSGACRGGGRTPVLVTTHLTTARGSCRPSG
jgi:hypothetical protein